MENINSKNNIVKYPNPVLKKKSKEVKEITKEIKELIEVMLKEMEAGEGIGISAPQLGGLKRIIVVKTEKEPQVFINPKITKTSRKKEILEEGCLSIPGIFAKIKRASDVELEALNLEGEKLKIKTCGLIARVFQHEIDHLNGILFIDRLGLFERLKIKSLLNKK